MKKNKHFILDWSIGWIIGVIVFCSYVSAAEIRTKIYCPECHRHIYTYDGEIPLNFKTTDINEKNLKGYKKGDKLICKFDQAPINGWEYWFWKRDRLPPKMVYPALAVMIKKDKSFVFYPDEANLEDN